MQIFLNSIAWGSISQRGNLDAIKYKIMYNYFTYVNEYEYSLKRFFINLYQTETFEWNK